VVGTAAERAVCEVVAADIGAGAVSLAGTTDLERLVELAAGAGVAVCNDSGLAHVCAAVGAPTVVVFGSTSSAWTAPLGPRVRVVQRAPVCAPCFRADCRIGYACLEAVTAREVLAACEELLAGREAA
jgi:heptosyltransferase II